MTNVSAVEIIPLIEEIDFSQVKEVARWKRKLAISGRWWADIKRADAEKSGSVKWDAERGLQLMWPGTPGRVRLWQRLSLEKLAPSPGGYDLRFQASFPSDFDVKKKLQWIAILEETEGGTTKFFSRFELSTARTAKRLIVLGTARAAAFSGGGAYRLSLQFKPDAHSVCMFSTRVEASRALLRPPAEPATPPSAVSRPAVRQPPAVVVQPASPVARLAPQKPGNERSALPVVPSKDPEARSENPLVPRPASILSSGPPARLFSGRKKAIVIAWDMGHNPVGRAYLVADMLKATYDVELIGPLFKQYGGKVWGPVQGSSIPFRTFAADEIQDFCRKALKFVEEAEADLVVACKARMPSMVLGMLLKHRLGCPVLIDVDDHELSFFPGGEPMSLAEVKAEHSRGNGDLARLYGETWTRLAESLVPTFDGVITSNVALQERFGGIVVRHARDEATFGPNPDVRARIRKEFGFPPEDKVILFLGTPRAHKGVFRIAEALERLELPNLVLCIIGSPNDKRIDGKIASFKRARIRIFPDQPWERLPQLITMADGVCLLQDVSSPVSAYQIPAKLTDALATGVPVAVTDVAPFRDIPSPSVVTLVRRDGDLDAFLTNISKGRAGDVACVRRSRDFFLGELSYAVNVARLNAISRSALAVKTSWNEQWTEVLDFVSSIANAPMPLVQPSWSNVRLPFPALRKDKPFDIAFFWKQNDTGLYGRRHDMLLKYLARHPRVGRIVQFDAPLEGRKVRASVRTDADAYLDQTNHVVSNVISRFLKIADGEKISRRVFVHRSGQAAEGFLGQVLPPKSAYVPWIRQTLQEAGINGPLIGWVAPVVFEYAEIHDELGFSLSIADLIDDQRAMPSTVEHNRRVRAGYEETLSRVNMVFTNCDAARDAFLPMRRDIEVITNAAEQRATEEYHRPAIFDELRGPIIGYVGNLRDRIDVELLQRMADEKPEWQIVLIGSAHRSPDVLRLRGRQNVHFMGVKPYENVIQYIKGFDVAIMPHVDNAVSKAMNPLKLYVYLSCGVPIVTTSVANIAEVKDFAEIASTQDEFIAKVESLLGVERRIQSGVLVPHHLTWSERVERIVRQIDRQIS
ncbi:glycosyltransferase [Reyranella sp.]|uniref:glycosyltransferase n=1 Tax=Reyranella sp. TaxID=1929291 RepID=UPI003D0A4448